MGSRAIQTFQSSKPEIEPVPGINHQAFVLKEFKKPRFDFIWHTHPEFELTYIQRGFGVRYVGNSIQPFREGDLCLLGGNLPHAYGSHPRHTGSCKWLVIHFLPETWGEAFWQLSENSNIVSLLRASRRGLRFHGKGLAAVGEKLAALQGMPPIHPQRIPGFLEILHLLCAVRCHDPLDSYPQTGARNADIDPRIDKVLRWLEQHAAGDIQQEDAAQLIGMTSAVFSRFFHQKTGRLFSRHVNEIRIARVCASLLTTRKTIAEIAFESGFNTLANFNRRFHEIVQLTPKAYRSLRA